MISPARVLHHLNVRIGPTDPSDLNRDEQRLLTTILNVFAMAKEGLRIEEKDNLDVNDDDWSDDFAEFEAPNENDLLQDGMMRFGDKDIPFEEVRKAAEYLTALKTVVFRPFAPMNSRYRWIDTDYLYKKIKEVAATNNFSPSIRDSMKKLAHRTGVVVKDRIEEGAMLHDIDIKRIALRVNAEEIKIPYFKASDRWIQKFKKESGIVSRRITKFVSEKSFTDTDKIKEDGDEFVAMARERMKEYPPEAVMNADQTGILKELYSSRCASIKGEKHTVRKVQATSSLSHSVTAMPVVRLDGTLVDLLFMVMSEPNGHFPKIKPVYRPANVDVHPGRSHIMTKEHLRLFMKNCIAVSSHPKKMLLIVDSWTSFKDHAFMKEAAGDDFDMEILNIPPKCTSVRQPLDVYFNLQFKQFLKQLDSYVVNSGIDFCLYSRDNIIRLVSQTYEQFKAPRYREMLRYAWYAAGYLDEHPGHFETPAKYSFSGLTTVECECEHCNEFAFMRCGHCEKSICWQHFAFFHNCV